MRISLILMMSLLILVACQAEDENPANTLPPSQIAAYAPLNPTPASATAGAVIDLSARRTPRASPPPASTALTVPTFTPSSGEAQPGEAAPAATQEETAQASAPTPTSNYDSLEARRQNTNLIVQAELENTCVLAGELIPFSLTITNISAESLYFYTEAQWQISINNSPVGPQLAPREPTLREEFVEILPNEAYTRSEEDLGLWVLSLGPESGISFSPTGLGLPAGEYWVTFLISNAQDGLTEQPDGTFLIDRAAWQGTALSQEVRFKVVDDLDDC